MSETIRWGVLGSGGIARRRTIPEGILPAKNAELVAVFDIDATADAEVAKEFNAMQVATIDELLEVDIDAVYVATPVHLHYEHVLACAEGGKHVLCEKPLGMNPEEAEKMAQACAEAGVQLNCAFMMRYHAQHQAALKLIESGKLGDLTFARAQLSCWYPPIDAAWRQDPKLGGGGSLIDLGGHCIDLLEMLFGEVTKVSCYINNTIHAYPSEDSAVALLSFENGAMATVDAFFCVPDASSKNRLELYGSKGSILAEGTLGQGEMGSMSAYLQEEDTGYQAQQERAEDGGMAIAPEPVNMYRAEIEDFCEALLKKTPPQPGVQAGIRSQKILTACYESAKTGQSIEV